MTAVTLRLTAALALTALLWVPALSGPPSPVAAATAATLLPTIA